MKQIGKRSIPTPGAPSGKHFAAAAIHQKTAAALAAIQTTGIRKGIYRFKSHEEMNRADEEALARAIAENVKARRSAA